jgi:hypothetical protein
MNGFGGAGVLTMSELRFAKQQPIDGEIVTHCGHLENKPHHFFGFGPDLPLMTFTRPDGSKFPSRWMVLCKKCFNRHSDAPEKCIRADSMWVGDEPAIKENVQ